MLLFFSNSNAVSNPIFAHTEANAHGGKYLQFI